MTGIERGLETRTNLILGFANVNHLQRRPIDRLASPYMLNGLSGARTRREPCQVLRD